MNELNLPGKVYFKTGSLPVALRELTEIYGLKRALIVTDAGRHAYSAVTAVTRILERTGMRTAEYFDAGDPVTVDGLRGALQKLQEFRPDAIVGVGESAALYAAKVLRVCRMHPELDPADFDALQAAASKEAFAAAESAGNKALLVLVPTTFADGSQNTPFAKIVPDTFGRAASENDAVTLRAFGFIPEISATDAQFALAMPADQVNADAAELKSLCSKALAGDGCNDYTEGLLSEAAGLVDRYVEEAAKGIPFALEKLMNAASIAGCAFGSTL